MIGGLRGRVGHAASGALFYLGFFGASGVYNPFTSVYFAGRELSGAEIGVLLGIGPLASLLATPLLTSLADRSGRRILMMALALLATALVLLLVPFAPNFGWLVAVMALLAVVGSPVVPIGDGLIARMADRYDLNYGQMRLWGSLGWAASSIAAGFVWQQTGFGWMFAVGALLFLLTILGAGLLEEESFEKSTERRSMLAVVADVRFRVLLVASVLVGLAMAMAIPFSSIYIIRLGGGESLVGLFSGIVAAAELPTMLWGERIMRRIGGPWALIVAYGLYCVSYAGLAVVTQPELLLLMAVLQGLGFGLYLPTTVRMVSALAPPAWLATYQGVLSSVSWGLAPLIAGPVGGFIFDTWSPQALFMIAAGTTVVAAAVIGLAQVAGVFRARSEKVLDAEGAA